MNNELDREALLIYLNDLRTMETIVHEDDIKTIELEKRNDSEKAKYDEVLSKVISFRKNYEPKKPEKHNMHDDTEYDDDSDEGIALETKVMLVIWIIMLPVFICVDLYIGSSVDKSFIHLIIANIIYLIICLLVNKKIRKYKENKYLLQEERKKKEYERNLKEWEFKQEKYQQELSALIKERQEIGTNYETIKKEIKNCISEMHNEKNDIAEKLQEAYNANIIPIQFRNIEGIYYLYDYISTSNQGLSEALMQCNLEAIKQQINQVVNLQGEMIVRQAQHNAAMYEQNQQLLNLARATVVNTAMAAKYAKISSVNSDVALCLQSQDLAYQKADFWLK